MDYSLLKKIALDSIKIDRINYGKSRVLTVAHDNDRGFLYNGKYYSQLVDTIEDDLKKAGIECISIARIISSIKGELSYGKVFSPEGRFARALIAKRIKGFLQSGSYPYSDAEELVWEDIINETGCEKILAIMPSRELCSVCRKRGVWVADIQHGVIAENHPWYGAQFRSADPESWLPNSFLTWDQGSADVLNRWVPPGVEVKVIGNRWLARFGNPQPDDTLVHQTLFDFRSEWGTSQGRKPILVGLSSCSSGIKNGIISDALISVIRNTAGKYRWLLRLHPNQLKGFASNESKAFFKIYERDLAGYAEWRLPTYTALPVVLLHSNLHIAWHSSVAIEGAQLGRKSALLDPRFRSSFAEDYYDFYAKKGFIDFIQDDEAAIGSWIENNINNVFPGEDYEIFDRAYRELLRFLTEN